MKTFMQWAEGMQWALYDPHTDQYQTDQDKHIGTGPDQQRVDALVDRALQFIQRDIQYGSFCTGHDVLGTLNYPDFNGRLIHSIVRLNVTLTSPDRLTEFGIPGFIPDLYAINGSAKLQGMQKGQIDLELYISSLAKRKQAKKSKVMILISIPDDAERRAALEQSKKAKQEQDQYDQEWNDLVKQFIPAVRESLAQALYHEAGHHERPHLYSNRAGRMNQFQKRTGKDRDAYYVLGLPDEWDTETSMMVRLYHRLPPEQQQNITYRQLIAMHHRGYIYLATPQNFARTVKIVQRKGVNLRG